MPDPGVEVLRFNFCGSWSSCFFSCSSTFSSFFSMFFSNSDFSSLRNRGRGSLVLPLTIKLVSPREMSSLSSILMASCLKENADITLGLDLTGSASDLEASGALSNGCVGPVVSPSSEGRTFLTTRRTTFTTFFRVRP